MTSDELLSLARSDLVDTSEPFGWSDEELYAYINDAYSMFVRLTGGIPDFLTEDVCMIQAVKDVPFADLHPKILRIRQAQLDPNGQKVTVINAQDTESLNDEDFGMLRRIAMNTSKGKVKYIVTGLQDNLVRWVNIPDQDYDVHLLVERLPLEDITSSGQEFTDVKSHHHFHFLKWIKSLAYAKQDAETYNKAKAAEEAAAFMAYCEFAKKEKDTLKHKVRVVRYGGI